jgi:dienelactone hydrolase
MTQTMSRRRILAGMGAGAAAVAFASCTGKSATSAADPTATTLAQSGAASELGQGSFALFTQADLNFQTLFALGEAGQVTAAGEVIAVVAQANAASGGANYQSLFDAWIAMADRLEAAAVASEKAGHKITARSQYIRAARYYAQALYWVFGTSDPAGEATVYTAMNDALVAAMKLMTIPVEQVSIPYSGGELPGWFLKPANDDTRRPTFIINNGSDGQNVDLLSQGGFAALERGYNVVIFEGPGQGSQLFLHDVPFRPDWQNVVTPIVDWLEKRPDVDKDKIAIRGISFGGLLVPQAASQEHRLAAVVADPGSLQTKDNYPAVIQDVINAGTAEQVNAEWNDTIAKGATPIQKFNLMKTFSIVTKEAHDAAMKGQLPTDFYSLWNEILKYDVTGVLGDITSPTMVTQYEGDEFFTTQGQQMYDGLKVEQKNLTLFTDVDGTQYHCGPMNPQVVNEACLDWIDGVMGR